MLALAASLITGCFSFGSVYQNETSVEVSKNISQISTNTPSKPQNPKNLAPTLVEYKGPVEHIFFHPLVAYPELAFDNDTTSKGYDDWFITVNEFNKILTSLYTNNYILIDIRLLFEERTENGRKVVVRKPLMLPENKKPLIISIDDLNYYDYMTKNGNVYKLILDSQGEVAAYSVSPKGENIISRQNEIIPILDDFVKQHSDFSFAGAKGIIALTGYQGILGYRTNDMKSPTYADDKIKVLSVISRLKETGWLFASHGYGHLDDNRVSYNRFVQDTLKWKNEVKPLIGSTPIYIYPFGSRVATGSPKFQYLLNSGFNVLCSVGPTPFIQFKQNAVMMDRRHIDGISLKTQGSRLTNLFNSTEIIDPVRAQTN